MHPRLCLTNQGTEGLLARIIVITFVWLVLVQCSGDHNHHPSNPPIRSQTLNNHNSSKNRVSRAFLEAEWCWVLPQKTNKQRRHFFCCWTLSTISFHQVNFVYLIRKFHQSEGLFVFDFWDSKHLLALSKAVHEIDSSQRDHSLTNNQYLGHSKSLCFMGRGPLVREMGQKRKRMVFTQTSTLFFVPSLQIHRTLLKARMHPTLFFCVLSHELGLKVRGRKSVELGGSFCKKKKKDESNTIHWHTSRSAL